MTRKWARADSETLSSPSDAITLVDTLTGETGKENNQNIAHLIPNGNTNIFTRFGVGSIDAGSNYASRRSINGGADTTQTNGTAVLEGVGTATNDDKVNKAYFAKLSTEELLWISRHIDRSGAGAANAPERSETVSKWVNLLGEVDTLSVNNGGAGDHNTDSNTAWFTGIDQAIAKFDSMRESFQALDTPFQQRFVEWFSGSVLSSIWDQNTIIGTISSFAMVDAIGQGFRILTSTTLPSRGCIVAGNAERPFNPQGCVMESVSRSSTANFQSSIGLGNRTGGDLGNTPDESMFFQNATSLTFTRFVTIRNVSTTATNTTVPTNTNFMHTRQELFPASATLHINGTLEATNVTNLPLGSSKLYCGMCVQNSIAVQADIRATFMEVYNTA